MVGEPTKESVSGPGAFEVSDSFVRLFEAQASRAPEAIAIIAPASGNQHLSYLELGRRATALAGVLRQHGVGPEVRVGLLIERSTDLLVALLATLESGGATVALDSSSPERRLESMLADARVSVLIAHRRLLSRVQTPPGLRVLSIDRGRARPCSDSVSGTASGRGTGERGAATRTQAPENSAAYVIYTSGSTGRPKGVRISHGALINFLLSMEGCPGLEGDDVLVDRKSVV